MHGCGSESDLIVNAEVDPMGRVFEGGVGIGNKTSLRRSAIEEVQNELRQEYDFLEEKRRELEFLDKGGDPLDFKFGNATSLSVQSTSLTDQHPDQFVTSEAKGSFAITASPHGDSVESSGRLGAPQLCEPNSADNLMLFDGENQFIEGDRSCRHPGRSNLTPSEQSSKLDRSRNAKELGNSAAFDIPRKAYKRRHRPRPNGDGTRSSSTDITLARGVHGTSLPSQHFSKDVIGLVSDGENPKDQNSSLNIALPSIPNGFMPVKTPLSHNQLDSEVHGVKAAEATTYLKNENLAYSIPEASASRGLLDNQHDQNSLSGVEERSIQEGPEKLQSSLGKGVSVAGEKVHSCSAAAGLESQASSSHINGLSCGKSYQKSIPIDAQSSGAALGTKGLDLESSGTRAIQSLDRNTNNEMSTYPTNLDSNSDLKEQLSVPEGTSVIESNLKEQKEVKADDSCGFTNEICNSGPKNHQSDLIDTSQEFAGSKPNLQSEVIDKITIQVEAVGPSSSETERKPSTNTSDGSSSQKGYACTAGRQGSIESRIPEPSQHASSHGVLNPSPEAQELGINIKLATRVDEDSILKEAQIIEAKHKRIAELSAVAFPLVNRRKSHWDYVLEEMVWLANDFAQERLWKMTAATQLCHEVAFAARLRFQEQNSSCKLKKVAHSMAKAVMGFWQSIEGKNKQLELPISRKDHALVIREYAMRFLKYNDSDVRQSLAEAPATPERVSDGGIVDVPREDRLGEENFFYAVSFGAMDAYRKSIESHVLHCEKTGSSMHEEVETSAYDTIPDYAFEEDEGETSPYDTVAIEGNKSSRFSQKKRKIHLKAYSGRSFGVRTDVPFTQRVEYKHGTHQSMQLGKKPSSNLNASIPTKRMRTASRQRVLSPYSATTSGCAQLPIKTDASSGDTSSFQDYQSTLHGGSHMPNSLEVESVGDFEKHLPFDSAEVSKPKKKKKVKILGSAYEHRWQVDSNFQNEQRDPSRKRLESHQLDSNGSNGLFGQHVAKKPKMMRQSLENSFENVVSVGGFVPSPAASQMSNMSNPNKLMRMLSGRDQGRRAKTLKMSAGQAGSGSPWSLFEDQALVVLVHDLGPNWELVSDAFNSTLQFKCIYRNPKECKEQHKVLMDRSSGDGADSADDSGSSQPYPSTLPGIPKGSARQLFQRLQGPMEEDTLRSHFEKIILIGQKYLLRKNQGYKHDLRQLQQPHDSHTHALSQLCPNNLSGGPILTPLDLFDDAPLPSPDYVSVGCQGPRPSGLSISSQCALNSVLPASGANSSVQGSSSMIGGNNFPSSSPLNREARYVVPRSASLPVDEHQRLQQYNQMRNMQSNMSAPGVLATTDRGGVHTLSSGNNMGMMGGINRGIPMARPGLQGVTSPPVLNSGSMLSPGMVAMPNTVNMHSGVSSNQVNSMMRPRDGLRMMQPPQNQEAQRQMMVPELQLQASQVSSQVVPPFVGLSSSFPNLSASPITPYPLHHQQSHQQPLMLSPHHPHLQGANHVTNSQQQAYAIRLAKERHLQQRRLQQQQFSHSQPQLPISSSLQNSPRTTSQSSSLPVSPLTSPTSMTPMPQPHALPAHGHARTAQTAGSSLISQMSKQRPRQTGRQQLQPAGRHHPPQRQQSQPQQQAKLFKGVGRGNMMMNQNMQIDPSLMNELSSNQANQSAEKGEQATSLMQGHGLYSGSAHSPVQLAKQGMAPHSSSQLQHPQPKIYSGQPAPSTKHLQQEMPSNPGNSNQNPASLAASDTNSSQQSVPSSVLGSSNHQALVHQQSSQVQPQPKLMNQKQATVQRVLQQNHAVNSNPSKKLQASESQAEQRSMCKTSQTGAITSMPQECNNATNVTDVSTLSTNQWKGTESLFDSIGAPPTNSAGSESVPQVNRGVSQRRSSGNLSPTGPDVTVNWLQKSSQLQPSSPVTQPQLQQQLSPLQHSEQQAQVLQAGNSSSFARPTDCRLD